ncbi:MAG: glycosyltransferase [Nanoarchaeota archaeon]|nr:glycosyltransferase [Nanoarchaeota archaeon]MBU0962882.1 glycosyltransferase [Nanoarchaeota archaeon]
MVKFSIIIPMRKIGDYVYEAMPYFESQTYKDFEIIILSEADETANFPKTRIIKVDRVSPAVKRNIGVQNAKGELIAFIDDDAYPEKDWLESSLKHFKNKNITAVAGPGVLPKKHSFFEKISGLVYELSSKETYYRYRKGKKIMEIEDYPTCNLIVRKKDFNKVGGFSIQYWGGEDTQLCHALTQKLKKKIIYDPDVLVYHHRRKDLMGHLKQSMFWGMWRGFFVKKYPKTSFKLTYFIPSLFVLWLIFGLLLLYNNIFKFVYIFSLVIYIFYLLILGIKTKSIKLIIPIILLTFLTHLVYGIGFIMGLLRKEGLKRTFNPSEKLEV